MTGGNKNILELDILVVGTLLRDEFVMCAVFPNRAILDEAHRKLCDFGTIIERFFSIFPALSYKFLLEFGEALCSKVGSAEDE